MRYLKYFSFIFIFSLLSAGKITFSTHGRTELWKFGGTLKRRSAYATLYSMSDFYSTKNWDFQAGGQMVVWLGRGKGLIQLDPQQADYLMTGGYRRFEGDKTYYVFFDHTCYHVIDEIVTRPLYWNKFRIGITNRKSAFKTSYHKAAYLAEIGFYLRQKDIPWLTLGLDYQYDINAIIKYGIFRIKRHIVFAKLQMKSGISLNYTFHNMIETQLGITFPGTEGDGEFIIGIRPYDKKTYREAPNTLFAGIRVIY